MSEMSLNDMDFSTQDEIIVRYLVDLSFIFRNFINCLWIYSHLYVINNDKGPIRKKYQSGKLQVLFLKANGIWRPDREWVQP